MPYSQQAARVGVICLFVSALLSTCVLAGDKKKRKRKEKEKAGRNIEQLVEPDYTKGEKLLTKKVGATNNNFWNLGSIGATGYIWAYHSNEKVPTRDTRMILIKEVFKGTPADGKLKEGDVLLGVLEPESGGKRFEKNAPRLLSEAITEAEKKENNGKLVLNVWRPTDGPGGKQGKTLPVPIILPTIGTYSKTTPWECERTKALIDAACASIDTSEWNQGFASIMEALGLLATGEDKYLPVIEKYARTIGPPTLKLDVREGGPKSWHSSYRTVLLCEYYLRTKDESVLHAIKEYATYMALGRSGVGTWSHSMAYVKWNGLYGPPSAYGAMNQCSITCGMALVLAQKCGIKSKEIDEAVIKATDFLRWYIDKGTIPYGDHPPAHYHDNNGRNSQAAVLFDIYGDKEAAYYFSRMTISSYNRRQIGHTGHYFGYNWGPLGAARGGEQAAQSFKQNIQWYLDLERRPDGSHIYQPQLGNARGAAKTGGWRVTGSRLLHYCLPRKELYITGKGGSCFDPIVGEDLKKALAAATFDPKGLSTDELLEALGDFSLIVRHAAARELGSRDEDVVEKLMAMLDSPNRYARYGACIGLKYAGRKKQKAVDALVRVLENGSDLTLRYFAALGLRIPRGADETKHMLGDAAIQAAPALLKLAATDDPERDPCRKLHAAIIVTLLYDGRNKPFRGFFPGGEGLEKIDRPLLISAIRSVLKNPNGAARSTASKVYPFLSKDEIEQLWADIYYATKKQAPSGVMFSDKVRINGLDQLSRRGVQEGIPVGIDYALRQDGWGNARREDKPVDFLLRYGAALKDYVPEIDKVLAEWRGKKAGNKRDQDDAQAFKVRLNGALKQPAPELRSIANHIKAAVTKKPHD